MKRRDLIRYTGASVLATLGTMGTSAFRATLAQSANQSLSVQWLGHSAFLFSGSGMKILVNPFRTLGCTAGYRLPKVKAKFSTGDAPLGASKVRPGMKQVACLSESARLLVFPLDELKRLPTGGKGVILMGLDDKERLASAIAVGPDGATYSGAGRAGKPSELSLDSKTLKSFAGNRARKGHYLEPRLKDGKLSPN